METKNSEQNGIKTKSKNADLLAALLSCVPQGDLLSCLQKYDVSALNTIFDDAALIDTVFGFFSHGLNVCATAKALYMHRNTLSYRLAKIKKITGLNLKDFYCAVEFLTLYQAYQKLRPTLEVKREK